MRCEELRTGFCRKQGVSEEPTIRPVFGSAVLRNPHPQFWPFRAKMRVRHLLIFCLCLSCSWPTWGRATLFLGRLRNLNSEEVDFLAFILVFGTTLIAQMVKNLPVMQETPVLFLGQEDPLEKAMATHSSILAWRIPRTV